MMSEPLYTRPIRTFHLIEGAKQAEGLCVIIDVFRAMSLECCLYDLGASLVRPVGSVMFLADRKPFVARPPAVLLHDRACGGACTPQPFCPAALLPCFCPPATVSPP